MESEKGGEIVIDRTGTYSYKSVVQCNLALSHLNDNLDQVHWRPQKGFKVCV